MNSIDIQYELKKRDISQKIIAIELGVSKMTISKTINKQMISDRVMRAIANKIEKDHTEVFPEYYLSAPKRKTSAVA
jgi:DNA transposition AAA+ family ATPase